MTDLVWAVRSASAVLLIGNALLICHEMGHYLAARALGIHASRFTIGFGPTIFQRLDRHGLIWTLRLLPLGGFVGFEDAPGQSPTTIYVSRSPLARIGIVAAGPAANLLVAVMVCASILTLIGQPDFMPIADTIVAGGSAERAGFQLGDRVLNPRRSPASRTCDQS